MTATTLAAAADGRHLPDGPTGRVLAALAARTGKPPKRNGRGWTAHCPAHEDRSPSLTVGTGDNGAALVRCHAGCSLESIASALGLKVADLFPPKADPPPARRSRAPGEPASVYSYRDETGAELFQVVRYLTPSGGKAFRQRRPDGRGGFTYNLDDARRVLYRLPKLLAAVREGRVVHIVEGEKDADNLAALGLAATTNPGGAGKWRGEYGEPLRGAAVVILPDADEPGRAHGQAVAGALHGVAASVRVVELPDLPPKGDVSDWIAAGGTAERLAELVAAAPEWTPGPEAPADARPRIVAREALAAVTDEAEAALFADPAPTLYVRARLLVRVVRDSGGRKKRAALRRPPGSPVIEPISVAALRERLDRAARWVRPTNDGDERPAMPPPWVAETLAARGAWPFPDLEGVTEAPTLRPDGSILNRPGYDEATGILYEPSADFPPMPDRPTRGDALRAADALRDPLRDFPFVADSDRAATVAALLSILARPAIEGPVPLFAFRAPTPGTGKSLLADVVAVIATGRTAPRMTPGRDDSETRKALLAVALSGAPLVLLDNVAGAFGSAPLAAALTAGELNDRILGESRAVTVPLRAVWMLTGNNAVFRGDLGRRVVPADMDPKLEHPEERDSFRYPDLLGHVRAERPRLVAAGLVILRAFHVAGRPAHGGKPFGSFESWDRLIRGAAVWAGLGDPCAGRLRIREEADADREALRVALAAWRVVFGADAVTAAVAVRKAEADADADLADADADLADALAGLAGDGKGPLTAHRLGVALRRVRDRVVGGLAFRGALDRKGVTLWRAGDAGDAGDESQPYARENVSATH